MRDEIMAVQKKIEELKQESFAMELLKDARKTNKRMFATLIIVLCMWFATIGYLVYILNDIGTIETKQEVTDIDEINGNIVNNGDVYGNN